MKNAFFSLLAFLAAVANASEDYAYQSGFGNHFSSEAIPGALPVGQNSPQVPNLGLYAEQLSGTTFFAPRHANQRTWIYRIRPSVLHSPFVKSEQGRIALNFNKAVASPSQLRWMPLPPPKTPTDFIEGFTTLAGSGDPVLRSGLAIHIYSANRSMENKCFYNSDGDFLIVPQTGVLDFQTEFGWLRVAPGEICVIPRGIKFRVALLEDRAYGYVCEVFNGHFRLPDLGPIGANGLANPRDFLYPVASFEDREEEYLLLSKFGGEMFQAKLAFSPFDAVAFHGNYLPYKYDLNCFCPYNTVAFDHADPSIFTVLTCAQADGNALADFVVFPPRWNCAEHTFRPPYFHRNCMSEFMGLIHGAYEAKEKGFVPGGASLHNVMSAHGPDAQATRKASECELAPAFIQKGTLAFMFESACLLKLTDASLEEENLDLDYAKCWEGIKSRFTR